MNGKWAESLLCYLPPSVIDILQLGGEDLHSDWLGALHYLGQKSTVMELELI